MAHADTVGGAFAITFRFSDLPVAAEVRAPKSRVVDTVSIARGGRVIFRSRFAVYGGMWANRCHILMHEERGMRRLSRRCRAPRNRTTHAPELLLVVSEW